MKRLHANVGPRNAALEQRPEILKAVSVYATVNVLSRVIYDLMRVVAGQSIVGLKSIGIESSASLYVSVDFCLQFFFLAARNHTCANLPATLKNSHDGSLVLGACASDPALPLTDVHVPRFAADEGFIYFDFAAELGPKEVVLHRKANPMQHEPCRLLGNLHVTGNLVATNAILAVSDHPSSHHPLVQTNWRILHNGADLDGELTPCVMAAALPSAPIRIVANLRSAASGTDYAIGPTANGNVVDAIIGVREVDNRFLKGLGFVFHG
jgi:hypothetical protein